MTLQNAQIIGYFSLPSPELAAHNPEAYSVAMANAPEGAGSCSQCGMGLRHHVVIRDGDTTRLIGLDCAQRVGLSADQLRSRLTDEQQAERDARINERNAQWQRETEAFEAKRAERIAEYGDILAILRAQGTEFHDSLADQLEVRPLSPRQAHHVAKATSSTGRRNKHNAESWDSIEDRCMN